ncbi:helix-turn-helix domain-containing protein [Murimonas intestini]|uniref:helix-turn-helix domain-containing protein n=1 Tax=Murimonas intestini TaxID=1337051 RepID=UPI0011DD95C3|nr:helix-turn-helix transcriptional regulator [Murimonas intestini]
MDYCSLGINIKTARKKVHMTQEELAEKVDISTVFVSQIENANRKASLETVYKISKALNITIDDLLSDEKQKTIDDVDELLFLLQSRSDTEKKFVTEIVKNILEQLEDGHIKND